MVAVGVCVVAAVVGVAMFVGVGGGGNWSLDRETCRPALAIELGFDSGLEDCLRKATDSGGLEMMVLEGPERGLEMATGSLFDCINVAMDDRW